VIATLDGVPSGNVGPELGTTQEAEYLVVPQNFISCDGHSGNLGPEIVGAECIVLPLMMTFDQDL